MVARRSYVMRIASDPACYLWTGHGDLDTPADAVDPSGARWKGAGGLVTLPTLQALINGVAERVTFVVSGTDAETLRLAQEDVATVRLAEVRIGYVEFDSAWQLVGGINYEWVGIADALLVKSSNNEGNRDRSISLMVGGADTFRANPKATYWTNASQQERSSGDLFCDQVASISNTVTRRFGPR